LMLTTDLTTGLFPVANVTWHSHSPGQKSSPKYARMLQEA